MSTIRGGQKRGSARSNAARQRVNATEKLSFEAKVGTQIQPLPNGCWQWTGTCEGGYGRFWMAGRSPVLAHRYVWEILRGEIPEGQILHHECENTRCVNPEHLTMMTQGDHMAHHHALRKKAS